MANETQLNNELFNSNETVINSELSNGATVINNELTINATVINTELQNINTLQNGDMLLNKYKILNKLDTKTGEADLYICTYQDSDYVAKVYRRPVAIKPEITDKLKEIDSPYIAKLYDTGELNGYPFEILPYYSNGSLQGRKFTLEELKKHIIPSLNAGLKELHDIDIVHKDLKPSNIMLKNNGEVAIIDFGISSVKSDNSTVIVTQTGLTPDYSAPETFRHLFLSESDYYSLGITIYELFCGSTPYSGLSSEDIERFAVVGKIPFPDDIPRELRELISALTYSDITNRNDKDNPNRRWGYEEVEKWCKGVKQVLPGKGVGKIERPYKFNGNEYYDIEELVSAMAHDWEQGKKNLFRGQLSGFYKAIDPEISGICLDAEEEYRKSPKNGDLIFQKTLYKLAPKTAEFYWKGRTYPKVSALGSDFLENLWRNDSSLNSYMDDILRSSVLSSYMSTVLPKQTEHINALKALEDFHRTYTNSESLKMLNYYKTAYLLSGSKILNKNGQQFATVKELTDYMKEMLDRSLDEFEDFCHSLIGKKNELDPQFEAWLSTIGKEKEVREWRSRLT